MKILLAILLFSFFAINVNAKNDFVKDPVVIEAVTNHTSIDDALQAAKMVLLKQKFILDGDIQKTGFTAKRTTGAKADYYVADVVAKSEGEKVKVTITFVKVGTGLLKLQKVADSVKAELEK